jgi:hypothetical protein
MLGFVTAVGTTTADPLSDVAAVDAFWQLLPRTDPVAAQKAVSGALADLMARGNPNVVRLRALLALDQRARKLVDALLVNYVAGDAESPALEKAYWQSAFELCRSFGHAHGHFVRAMRDSLLFRGWREYVPFVLLRLFQHRQIELLLRPFTNELSTRFPWKELHDAYQYAHSRGLLRQSLPISRCRAKRKVESTLEREYIHVLVQDLINGGQFPPHEAFWVSQRIPRWCNALTPESHQVLGPDHRFVADLDGDAGLDRPSSERPGTPLYLDTAAALESIRDETSLLRDSPGPARASPALGRGQQLKLMRKLGILFSPKPPVIARRGERRPVLLTVETVVGLAEIIRVLRDRAEGAAAALPVVVPEVEEITITEFGGFTEVPMGGFLADGNTILPRPTGDPAAKYPIWKLVDQSASGCRLLGQIFGSNWVTPGALLAFREDAAVPWTLAVVRRVEKRAGNRAEIGLEYIGRDPRPIRVIVDAASDEDSAGSPDRKRPRFAALYLPEGSIPPAMPIKTLVLPVHAFAPNDRLMLQSGTAIYIIHMKEPLEEQGAFIWSPFEIVEREPRDHPASVEATSGTS